MLFHAGDYVGIRKALRAELSAGCSTVEPEVVAEVALATPQCRQCKELQESCKKELSPPLCCPGDKPHFQKWILKIGVNSTFSSRIYSTLTNISTDRREKGRKRMRGTA